MNEKNKLTLYMGMFYFLVILVLGLIVIDEKGKDFQIPKIEKKLKTYIQENYKDSLQEFQYGKTKRRKNKYTLTIYNKKNSDLYFTTSYEEKKITTTYQKDYVEGKTLNKNIEKYLNKELEKNEKRKKLTYDTYKITYNTKLNNCTSYVKKALLEKKYNLPIYTIEVETSYKENLKNTLIKINNDTKKLNLNPKNYHMILNNEKFITKSLDLEIDSDIIEKSIDNVITLIENNDFDTLKKYNVRAKYLN